MTQFLFLVNPVAGTREGPRLRETIRAGMAQVMPQAHYAIVDTGAELLRDLAEQPPACETLVIAGGDGTLSQVIAALGRHAALPRIGIVPAGTGNDLAQSLNIAAVYRRGGIPGVLGVLQAGNTARIDLLRLNDTRLFINYFGMGIDARIAREFNRMRTNALCGALCAWGLGKTLFALSASRSLRSRVAGPLRFDYRTAGGASRRLLLSEGVRQVLVTNSKTYAGGVVIAPRCRMDDGLFEVTVVPGLRAWMLMHLHRLRRHPFEPRSWGLRHFQACEITISAPGRPSCQVDGETCEPDAAADRPLRIASGRQIEVLVP
jgi:diacylglycerol kinase family enzyme